MKREGTCRCEAREGYTHETVLETIHMYSAGAAADRFFTAGEFPVENVLGLSIDVARDTPHLARVVEEADCSDDMWLRCSLLLDGLLNGVPTWTRTVARRVTYLVLFDFMWHHALKPATGDPLFSVADFNGVLVLPAHERATWLANNLVKREIAHS